MVSYWFYTFFLHDISLVAKTPGESSGSIGFLVKMNETCHQKNSALVLAHYRICSILGAQEGFLLKGWDCGKTLNNIILGSYVAPSTVSPGPCRTRTTAPSLSARALWMRGNCQHRLQWMLVVGSFLINSACAPSQPHERGPKKIKGPWRTLGWIVGFNLKCPGVSYGKLGSNRI